MNAQTAGSRGNGNWARLVGAFVEIRRDQRTVRRGVVEDAMPDSSALWLAADATNQRMMYAAADDYQVWIHPRQLGSSIKFG
ncbi:hypothetical protein [Arthrobacter sp. NPDC057009]|uniref:hypothetical protein n=1 Tax=Arthrobacter sp. NPDC057009 TaxID=3345996 RepID=UPI00362CD6F8